MSKNALKLTTISVVLVALALGFVFVVGPIIAGGGVPVSTRVPENTPDLGTNDTVSVTVDLSYYDAGTLVKGELKHDGAIWFVDDPVIKFNTTNPQFNRTYTRNTRQGKRTITFKATVTNKDNGPGDVEEAQIQTK